MPLAESTNVKVSENTNAEIVEPVISLGKLVADDKPELQIYSTLQSRQLILLNNEVKKEKPLLNITPVKNWKVLSELNAFGTYALQNQSGGIGFESLVSIRNMHTPFVFSTGFGYQRFNFLMREEVIVDKGDGANHPTNNAPRYSTSKHKIDYLAIPVKFTYQRNRWQTGLGLKYGFQLKEPSQKFTNQILWVTSHLGYRVTRNLTVIGGINLDVYQKSPKALLTSYSEKDLSKLPMNHVQVGLSFSF